MYRKIEKEPSVHFTMEELEVMSTPELYELARKIKNELEQETLRQAIVTVLGSRRVYNPTF